MARIVHWGKYYPPDHGGIESVTKSLAAGAAVTGNQVKVVCFTTQSHRSSESVGGVWVQRMPPITVVASQPVGWTYFVDSLREGRRADLIHLHVPNMLGALAAVFLRKGPKLLVHWHSDVVGKGVLGRILRPLERAMLKRADCVVCTSQAYADDSELLRPFRNKIVAVPIGMPDVQRAAEPPRLPDSLNGWIAGRRIILAVGRLVSYKGFDVLIEAAASLPEDVAVVIAGGGPLQPTLQAQIRSLGLEHKVLLAGRVENSVLDALYRNAGLFCLPSVERSEAFGVVLVEAMAYGLPIVATRIAGSGVPWVNQHHVSGLNVAVGNASALAAACNEIFQSDELRNRLSSGARNRYLEYFTEQASVDGMLKVYRTLLA